MCILNQGATTMKYYDKFIQQFQVTGRQMLDWKYIFVQFAHSISEEMMEDSTRILVHVRVRLIHLAFFSACSDNKNYIF